MSSGTVNPIINLKKTLKSLLVLYQILVESGTLVTRHHQMEEGIEFKPPFFFLL
jgi:hypothetical protein